MVSLAAVCLAAVKAVSAAMLLFVWATVLAMRGSVDRPALSKLSHVTKVMFLPCLTFDAIASGMSVEFVYDNWMLVFFGAVVVVLGFVYGHCAAVVMRVPLSLRPWFTIGIALPNMIALPLILVEAICHEKTSGAHVSQCVEGATTRLFTVTLTHTPIIWICFMRYAQSFASETDTMVTDAAVSSVAADAETASLREGVDASSGSTAVAPSRIGGASVAGASEPGDMAAPKPGGSGAAEAGEPRASDRLLVRLGAALTSNPPITATVAALAVAFCPPVRQMLYAQGAPGSFLAGAIALVGKASPGVTNIISGGVFGLQLAEARKAGGTASIDVGLSKWAFAVLVVSRIVIVPLLSLCLVYAFWDRMPVDPWSRLILLFQPAGTTANTVTLMAQVLNQPKGAELVAMTMIPQMILYVPIATFLIAAGLAWEES